MIKNYSKMKTFLFFLMVLLPYTAEGANVQQNQDEYFDCYDQGHKIPIASLVARTVTDPAFNKFSANMTSSKLIEYSFLCGKASSSVWDSTGMERPDGPEKEVNKSILEALDIMMFKLATGKTDSDKEYGLCYADDSFADRIYGKFSTKRMSFSPQTYPMGYEACHKYGGTYTPVLNPKPHPIIVNGKEYSPIFAGGVNWIFEKKNIKTKESVCYQNDEKNCAKYGRLYTWQEAETVCPAGFMLPSAEDYRRLFQEFSKNDYNYIADPFLASDFQENKERSIGIDIPLTGEIFKIKRGQKRELVQRASKGKPAKFEMKDDLQDGDVVLKKMGDSTLVLAHFYTEREAYLRVDSGYIKVSKHGEHLSSEYSQGGYSDRTPYQYVYCIVDPATQKLPDVPDYVEGSFTDPRDGKTYKTVLVDNINWMAENLNYKTGRSTCYDNKESNCQKYGRLYSWSDAENACPDGWELPNVGKYIFMASIFNGLIYEKLMGILKNQSLFYQQKNDGGKGFKSTSKDWINDGAGTDQLAFNALPAGIYEKEHGFAKIGEAAAFWTSSINEKNKKHETVLLRNHSDIVFSGVQQADETALSIRCVQSHKENKSPKTVKKATKISQEEPVKPEKQDEPVKQIKPKQVKQPPKELPKGTLTISADHADKKIKEEIRVTIDGKPAKLGANEITIGKHSVRVFAKCQETLTDEVDIKEGANTNLKKTLKQAVGYLTLTSIKNQKSVSEQIFLDNKKIGKTPFKGKIPVCGTITIGKDKNVVPVIIRENDSTTFEFDFTPPEETFQPSQIQKHSPESEKSIIRLPLAKSVRINYNDAGEYLDEDEFIEYLKEQKDAIEEAYKNFVDAKGVSPTSIKFKISIDFKTGNVTDVKDVSKENFLQDLRHTLLFKKVSFVISQWTFKKKKKGGTIFVEFPIKFDYKK